MPDMDKLNGAIDWAEEHAYGSDTDGTLARDRSLLIDLYLGENVDQAPEGRSQVVDRSVFETVQWILPSLCRIFASGSDLVMIPPIGPDDEEGAKQEAEYLNWVMTQKNPWFETFITWATDALMTRNAYAIAYNDKTRITEIERYEKQTADGVAMLLQDGDVEVITSNSYPDDSEPPVQPMPMVGPDGQPIPGPDGQPIMQPPPPPAMLYDLEIRRVDEKSRQCVRVLPPERCKVSHYTPSYRIGEECDYFEYWEEKTLSALRSEGFDVDDDITDGDRIDTEEDSARDFLGESRNDDDANNPAMRRVKARFIWIRHDYDEDGIAELQYVLRIGQEILHREEVSSIPVACMVPSPLPHRHMGLGIGDMVADIQRIKTAIMRQGLDNLYLSNNPQKVINQNLVNIDDLKNAIPGGIIRTDDVNAIRYEKHPFVFPEAMQGLEYMDQVRENRTGTNRYFTGIDQNAMNKTATGIQQLSTMAAQRVEQIARIMGFAVEDLARVVHELILKAGHKKEVVQIRGKWIEVDPATWRKRSDFKISVGFASGNKDAMVNRLQMIAVSQVEALKIGLPIVKPENMYETMLELTKASDFSNPERFWTDPSKAEPQPQQPSPEMIQAQQDGEKLKADMMSKTAELELTKETKSIEFQQKDKELQINAELKKYQIDTDAQVKLQLAAMQAENSKDLETHKSMVTVQKQDRMRIENIDKIDEVVEANQKIVEASANQAQMLAASLVQMVTTLSEAVAKLNAPKVPIRDASGRIVRIDTVQ